MFVMESHHTTPKLWHTVRVVQMGITGIQRTVEAISSAGTTVSLPDTCRLVYLFENKPI